MIISKAFLGDPFVFSGISEIALCCRLADDILMPDIQAENSGCCPDLVPFFLLASEGRMSPWGAHSQAAVARTLCRIPSLSLPLLFEKERRMKALQATVAVGITRIYVSRK